MDRQEELVEKEDKEKPTHKLLKEPEDVDDMEKRLMKQVEEEVKDARKFVKGA